MSDVRVRFAPSPTGYMHIGSLRTALYNFLFARHHNGTFILRIEDTDQNRFVEGAVENIIETLKWAGTTPDEGPSFGGALGPYFQSQRLDLYKKHAIELIDKGLAYYAFDTTEELEEMHRIQKQEKVSWQKYDRDRMNNSLLLPDEIWRKKIENAEPYVIRLKVPDKTIQFTDVIRGVVTIDSHQIDDQILLKSDGFPTYHLANVVDDHYMKITHVIRGEEWLSSVPKHVLLYEYLGWDMPILAHLPLIKNPDGSKMSKRDGMLTDDRGNIRKVDADVSTYINLGYEKEAVINYIALLGWNPGEGDERQIFSLADLIREFSLERVNKAGAIFDLPKLQWINGEHINLKSDLEIAEKARPLFQHHDLSIPADDYLLKAVRLMKSRLHFISDLVTFGSYLFKDPESYDDMGVKKSWKAGTYHLLNDLYNRLSSMQRFDTASIETEIRRLAESRAVSTGKIIHPVRLAISGATGGPGLFELMELLGQETVLRRFKRALNLLPASGT